MASTTSASHALVQDILNRLDELIDETRRTGKPLEVDPLRGQLFELFVMAEAAGLIGEDAEPDLSADGLCHALAGRWGLTDAARASFQQQTRLPPTQLERMRLLWSVMRMWMEWTYAWRRWGEFHDDLRGEPRDDPPSGAS